MPEPEFEIMRKAASDNILLRDRRTDDDFHDGHFRPAYPQHYENEKMRGIEQPDILISDAYQKKAYRYNDDENLNGYEKETPEAPPRKQRSLKSLISEHDSIIDEFNPPKQDIPIQNVSFT